MLPFGELTGTKGARTPGEEQARRLTGTEQIKAGEEAVGILPLAQPRRTGSGMEAPVMAMVALMRAWKGRRLSTRWESAGAAGF